MHLLRQNSLLAQLVLKFQASLIYESGQKLSTLRTVKLQGNLGGLMLIAHAFHKVKAFEFEAPQELVYFD